MSNLTKIILLSINIKYSQIMAMLSHIKQNFRGYNKVEEENV